VVLHRVYYFGRRDQYVLRAEGGVLRAKTDGQSRRSPRGEKEGEGGKVGSSWCIGVLRF